MRFRKSIQIVKGVKVNFSKSGISYTIGGRGLSVNVGKKGAYLNTGIPGTGLYDRKKISGTSSHGNRAPSITLPNQINVRVEDDGTTIIMDSNNYPITDEAVLRKIKQTTEFKQLRMQLMNKLKDDIEKKSHEFIDIYKMSSEVHSLAAFQKLLKNLKLDEYCCVPFSEQEPEEKEIESALELEATQNVKTFAFWRIRALRKEYVDKELSARYLVAHDDWQKRKDNHETEQSEKGKLLNTQYRSKYVTQKELLEKAISGDIDYTESKIEEWISSIELPVDFSLQFECDKNTRNISLDLDLPEIETIPKHKAVQLASGQVKSKPKTQKEIKYDYMCCVYGLAIFFSSYIFEISPAINEIIASGYTQRRNKSGDIQDDYVYSVRFNRTEFENTNFDKIDILDFWNKFESRCSSTQTYDMRTIVPF